MKNPDLSCFLLPGFNHQIPNKLAPSIKSELSMRHGSWHPCSPSYPNSQGNRQSLATAGLKSQKAGDIECSFRNASSGRVGPAKILALNRNLARPRASFSKGTVVEQSPLQACCGCQLRGATLARLHSLEDPTQCDEPQASCQTPSACGRFFHGLRKLPLSPLQAKS